MDKKTVKFLSKYGIHPEMLQKSHIEAIEIDVTGQSSKITNILDECSVEWSPSSNRYGGGMEIISAIADYWTLCTMLYALYRVSNNIVFFVKVNGASKPIKMLIADYLRYLADQMINENDK